MHKKRAQPISLLAPTVILLLAALLRLGWPGLTEFKSDEAHIAALALQLVEGKSLPLQGTGTSVGLPKSPLSVYIYALPLLLWPSPLFATWFTGALNVCGVALCWWIGRRCWGIQPASFAALLLAASPWAVHFSRKIWEPNLLAPFSLAYLATALLAFAERRRWALAAHLVSLATVVQLHYSGLALVPLTALLLVMYHRQVDHRTLLAGAALAATTSLPFLYYLLIHANKHGWQSITSLVPKSAGLDWQSLQLWWIAATGSHIHALAGWPAYQDFLRTVPNPEPLCWVLGALIVGGIAALLWAALWKRAQASLIIALCAIAPLLSFTWHAMPLYLHYYVVSLPASCLAAGFLLARATSSRWRALHWSAVTGALSIAAAQAGIVLALFSFISAQATPGGFGLPLKFQLQAATRALNLGPPVVVISPGDDPRTSEWAAVFDILLHRTPHRFVDGSSAALFSSMPATLLITPGASTAVQIYTLADVLQPANEIPTRLGEEPFRVARLGSLQLELTPSTAPCTLANGVEIAGYRLNGDIQPGQAFSWWIAWLVRQPPSDPTAKHHLFNHLVDAQGQRWAQADGPTVPTKDWAVGDLVVQAFQLEVPPEAGMGPFWMRVGMYTYPELENQPVLDAAGNSIGEAITLGPLRRP